MKVYILIKGSDNFPNPQGYVTMKKGTKLFVEKNDCREEMTCRYAEYTEEGMSAEQKMLPENKLWMFEGIIEDNLYNPFNPEMLLLVKPLVHEKDYNRAVSNTRNVVFPLMKKVQNLLSKVYEYPYSLYMQNGICQIITNQDVTLYVTDAIKQTIRIDYQKAYKKCWHLLKQHAKNPLWEKILWKMKQKEEYYLFVRACWKNNDLDFLLEQSMRMYPDSLKHDHMNKTQELEAFGIALEKYG